MTPDQITQSVSTVSGVPESRIRSNERKRESTLPRQVATYLVRRKCGLSFYKLSDHFNLVGHRSSSYNYYTAEGLLESNDEAFMKVYNEVLRLLE